ncbi:MAG TPA: WYL domain-containing protein, partial [Solirubrobacterales bacterium]|nr:WYL domain-containing protein [Solirubrobacterales bacterium]
MAKDTEKLIRQLSLISFLMAQGRPVSALEIKREVEGYSDMNDDAFARRFYADRAELESLGIQLGVEKPGEGFFEAELYSLPPENFYLDPIEFDDDELASLSTALSLLSQGEFAYAEPLRLALQQVAWGHPNPVSEGERAPVEMAMTASAGGRDLSQRLSKIETAISRRKTIEFTYYTMERDETEKRRVDPYHLVFRSGQFYLIGHSHERDAVRVFRLSRIQGKVGYASKAEHDFSPPEEFDRRDYGQRADWQLGEIRGRAKIFVRERISWLIERDYGAYGELRAAKKSDGAPGKGSIFETDYASPRELIA